MEGGVENNTAEKARQEVAEQIRNQWTESAVYLWTSLHTFTFPDLSIPNITPGCLYNRWAIRAEDCRLACTSAKAKPRKNMSSTIKNLME